MNALENIVHHFDGKDTLFLAQKIAEKFALIAVDLPPAAWWLAALAILTLAAAALADAFSGRVPDPLVLLGLVAVTAARGYYSGWPLAAQYLLSGFVAAFAVWMANHLYYKVFTQDAIGMGDAKWTALAVSAFGVKPALWAWVMGAWLGISWLALRGLFSLALSIFNRSAKLRDQYEYIHFAPFLFMGLLTGLYWYYLR